MKNPTMRPGFGNSLAGYAAGYISMMDFFTRPTINGSRCG